MADSFLPPDSVPICDIEVTGISPSSGGTEGGTFLHIHGTGLDDTTDAETRVLVGGMLVVFLNCIDCPVVKFHLRYTMALHCVEAILL